MAKLPDLSGENVAIPQPSGGVASFEAPNWRQVGMSGDIVSRAGQNIEQAADIVAASSNAQDQVTALSAANKLNATKLALQMDPKNGFANIKGNGVIGPTFTKNYTDQFTQAQTAIADSLQNENQKRIFSQHAEVIGLQYQSNLLLHQAHETLAFNKETRTNTVELGLNDIAAHPYDDTTYDLNQLQMGKTVVDAGKDMGLTGGDLANWVKAGTTRLQSKGLLYRTLGMLNGSPGVPPDPMKASDFFGKHEMDFDPQDRINLSGHIRTAVDAQVVRAGGQNSYKAAIGTAPAPALPANLNADFVKPYEPARISQIIEQVKKPSPYDADINAAAQAYNITPSELKLRLVAESGLNPNTVSPKGAVGIAQFMPDTAKTFGIDPKDPKQSIMAAAQLMAKAGGTVGGDMSKVDRAYYGGANQDTSKPTPNTDQYVENLRAVRQGLFGAPQPVLTEAFLEGREGAVIDAAKAAAQAYRPGDYVLQDQWVAEARKNWANDYAAIRGKNQQTVSNIMSMVATDNPPKSLSDLPPTLQQGYAQLPGTTQEQIRNRLKNGDQKLDEKSLSIYYQLLGQASNDPQSFAGDGTRPGTNLLQYYSLMPDHLLLQLMTTQKSMATKDAQMQAKGANMQHALSIAENYALKPLGIMIPTKDTPQNKRQLYDQFTGRLSEAVDNFRAANGKNPTDDDLIKISKNLTGTMKVPGVVYGTNDKPGYALTPEQEAQATVSLTPAEKSQTSQILQSRYGFAPTDSMIQQAAVLERLHPNDLKRFKEFDESMRQYANKTTATTAPSPAPAQSAPVAAPAVSAPPAAPPAAAVSTPKASRDFYSSESVAQRNAAKVAQEQQTANAQQAEKADQAKKDAEDEAKRSADQRAIAENFRKNYKGGSK